jgi:hypothetical protein
MGNDTTMERLEDRVRPNLSSEPPMPRATPNASASASVQSMIEPASFIESIQRRAFEIYCEHGYENGHDLDHWLRAESEVRAAHESHLA